jgi:galactokinase
VPDHVTAFAPGRVNLIGEHTDYNGGLALPFAISEGITVVGDRLAEPRIEAVALDLDQRVAFELGDRARTDGWRAFVRGAVAELQQIGVDVRGARLQIHGDLPRGAGLSSSAALEVALALALIGLADADVPDRVVLAQLCSKVENDWVGAQTGLLDQLASLFGESDHALRIDFKALSVDPVALQLDGYRLVTLDSGERHAHAASGYNERRAECARACQALGLDSLREATEEMIDRLPPPLSFRAAHVLTENIRVEAAVAALARGDLDTVGRLLDASHASLRDCYDVSTPAVEAAVARLRDAGAIGARIVGGGFGGHVLGLMPPDADVADGALEVRPGPGAHLLTSCDRPSSAGEGDLVR